MVADRSRLVLGADGCRRGGWVVALIDGEELDAMGLPMRIVL